MNAVIAKETPTGFSVAQYLTCLNGIVWREALRFVHQRERFVSALVRPLGLGGLLRSLRWSDTTRWSRARVQAT